MKSPLKLSPCLKGKFIFGGGATVGILLSRFR